MQGSRLLFLVVAGVLACTRVGALDQPADTSAGPQGPAPWAARMQWMRETTVQAYDSAGTRDPKWDDLAHRTLEAAARTWGQSPRRNGDEDRVVLAASEAAIKAGCDDPLVMYARARSATVHLAKPPEVEQLQEGMAEAFRASKYPAIRKCFGMLRVAQVKVLAAPEDQKTREAAHALVDEAMGLLPEVFAEPRLPREELVTAIGVIGEVSETVDGSVETRRDRAIELLEQSVQPRAALLTARAEALIRDGWRARGGFSRRMTPDALRVLSEKMPEARALVNEAWELDPNDIEVALQQMHVDLNGGAGDNETEKWFAAATKIDPDDRRSYAAKLRWLDLNWSGSADDILSFGRECAATGRWSGLVPLVLVDVHCKLGRKGRMEAFSNALDRTYFQSDPKIWEEIKPVYDRYLQEPDASNYHKTRYAVIAAYSEHWKEANLLFKSMRPNQWANDVLFDMKALEALVKETARKYVKACAADRAARAAAGNAPPPNDVFVSTRWGGGQKWVDVTAAVKDWLSGDDPFWADKESLGAADPTPGWQKHLEMTYKKDGKTMKIKVAENEKVPSEKLKP